MQNFGKINNSFNELLIDSITRKDAGKKRTYQKYLKSLKESRVLKAQYLVYKNLESKIDSDSHRATEYVKENVEMLSKFSQKEISEANEKILKLLGESINLDGDYKEKVLHENIAFLISKENTPNNIDAIFESRSFISEHIVNNKEKDVIAEPTVPTKVLAQLTVKKFNEKYSDLDEGQRKLLNLVIESDDEKQKSFLTTNISKCVDLVNENLEEADTTTKGKLLEVKDRLLRMEFNKELFVEDTIKIINLQNDLTE